jgi:hypothetical protein
LADGGKTCGLQHLEVVRWRDPGDIDPQRHRRLGVVGCKNRLPVQGMIRLQPLDPPCRVVPACHWVGIRCSHQPLTLPKKSAQAGVDEAGAGAQGGVALGGLDSLIDQGEGLIGRLLRIGSQSQRGAQQRIDSRRWRSARQFPAQRLGATLDAHHMKGQRLHPGAKRPIDAVQHLRQRTAVAHIEQHLRCALELAPQGNGWAGHRQVFL